MTDFKAKMHPIRFRLGLRPRPRCGSLQRSPDPLAGFGGRFAARGRAELEKRSERWRGRGRGGGEGKGGPQVTVEPGPLRALLRHCLPVSDSSKFHDLPRCRSKFLNVVT